MILRAVHELVISLTYYAALLQYRLGYLHELRQTIKQINLLSHFQKDVAAKLS